MWMLWLAWALGAVPETAPAPLDLEDTEIKQLAKGHIPVRFTDGGTSGGVIGIVDIAASEDEVWKAVMDVKARVGEISGLREVNLYEDTSEKLGVQWVLSVFGTGVTFHIRYDLDGSKRWCRYRLDTSRENDLVDVQGAYQIYRVGEKTRLVYRSETESGRRVPGFVKRWLASDSLTSQLEGIKARAEAR